MRADNIIPGRFYLNRDSTQVREVLKIVNGTVFWQGYDYASGEPGINGFGSEVFFARWARRELDEDEEGRLQINLALKKHRELEAGLTAIALQVATVDQLRSELRERGWESRRIGDVKHP
jgi:hypothetical protein